MRDPCPWARAALAGDLGPPTDKNVERVLTQPPIEPASRERAQAALRAALSDAAAQALAEGVPPAALVRYGNERAVALRRSASVGEPP